MRCFGFCLHAYCGRMEFPWTNRNLIIKWSTANISWCEVFVCFVRCGDECKQHTPSTNEWQKIMCRCGLRQWIFQVWSCKWLLYCVYVFHFGGNNIEICLHIVCMFGFIDRSRSWLEIEHAIILTMNTIDRKEPRFNRNFGEFGKLKWMDTFDTHSHT